MDPLARLLPGAGAGKEQCASLGDTRVLRVPGARGGVQALRLGGRLGPADRPSPDRAEAGEAPQIASKYWGWGPVSTSARENGQSTRRGPFSRVAWVPRGGGEAELGGWPGVLS